MNNDDTAPDDLLEFILEEAGRHGLSEDSVSKVIQDAAETSYGPLLAKLFVMAPAMLSEWRSFTEGFEGRNYKRWKEPIDLLMVLWVIAEETSSEHQRTPFADSLVTHALCGLQPRALLIAREAMHLMQGGFADGALARWRSLHELTVTALFLVKHGEITANAYLLNTHFSDLRSAESYNRHAKRANLTPISSEDVIALKEARDQAEEELGRTLKNDWDWAKDCLEGRASNFAEIEKDFEMDHWRPRYKWACRHIHPAYVRADSWLGMKETSANVFQVGPSNAGLVDPLHMVVISLTHITSIFILHPDPSIKTIITVKVMRELCKKIGQFAIDTEKVTYAAAKQQAGKP
ncbi:MAG: DUF5677 domain-containing protein [Paracoccus sp.]|nr:DUF5677 domain-containing protein [Paracoccus sp. (in: a-proteobacteria)]